MSNLTSTTSPPRAPDSVRRDDVLCRIRSEYMEMPGLALTLCQAQRMWNLCRDDCERALGDLVDAGFLERTPFGTFVRAGSARSGV